MEKKKPILRIKKERFIDWMYDDKHSLRGLAEGVINDLKGVEVFNLSLKEVYESAGYVPLDFVLNPEVVSKEDIVDEEISFPSKLYDVFFVGEDIKADLRRRKNNGEW